MFVVGDDTAGECDAGKEELAGDGLRLEQEAELHAGIHDDVVSPLVHDLKEDCSGQAGLSGRRTWLIGRQRSGIPASRH